MKHHGNTLSNSESGDTFGLERRAKAIAFRTSEEFKVIKKLNSVEKGNIMENRSSYIEWGDYFSLEKKAKAIPFGTSKEIEVIKELNAVEKSNHHVK